MNKTRQIEKRVNPTLDLCVFTLNEYITYFIMYIKGLHVLYIYYCLKQC